MLRTRLLCFVPLHGRKGFKVAIDNTIYQLVNSWFDLRPDTFRNRYYFQRVSGTGLADNLVGAFLAILSPVIGAALSDDMTQIGVEAFNLVDSDDFFADTDASTGGLAGTAMPGFVCASLKVVRPDRAFRSGGKRYGRIPQSACGTNFLTVTYQANLQNVVDQLNPPATLDFAGTSWAFVMTRSEINASTGKYEIVDAVVPASVAIRGLITTQNTRKSGVGE